MQTVDRASPTLLWAHNTSIDSYKTASTGNTGTGCGLDRSRVYPANFDIEIIRMIIRRVGAAHQMRAEPRNIGRRTS